MSMTHILMIKKINNKKIKMIKKLRPNTYDAYNYCS